MHPRHTPRRSTLPTVLAAVAALTAAVLTVPASPLTESAAAAPARTEDDLAPRLTAQTFTDPPTAVRPKYRWWVPLAYTDDAQLENELQQMKDAGAGGAEVAAFSVEGSGNNKNPFLETYGWGTPRWAEKTRVMMKAARDRDLSLDLAISPRWPATAPTVADVNHPAAAQQIAFATEFAKGGTSRSGDLPRNLNVTVPTGAQTSLIAVVVARCADSACATQSAKPRLLDRDSVVDVTDKVDDAGRLDLTFDGDADSTYALLAFYQLPTGQSLSGYTPTGTNYVLDTLSVEGAKATTDFYDEAILTPDVRELLSQLRSDFYEDSLEIGSTQKWTSDFVTEWTKRRGYSPVEVLPALAGAGDQGMTSRPAFDFTDGSGARVRTDYRQTWSDLYIDNRLEVLREWANRHHMQTRIQPYGGPIDITEAAGHIDVPEGESLAFGMNLTAYSNVEDYKVVASGAHLAGKPVVSDECCAFATHVWGSTVADATERSNLQAVYRGFAGGVNQVVWHGFPYLSRGPAGAGQQSTWPGMSYGGNTSYSEAFGSKGNPSWSDYRAVNDHLARMQLVLRQGAPRYDLAVYRHDFGLSGAGTTGVGSDKLLPSSSATAKAGFSYEYLSPAQLRSKDARFEKGALFPDTSAYQAVLLDEQDTMAVDTAERLRALARKGLPIVVVGELPTQVPGFDHDGTADAELRRVLADLVRERTVVRVDDERKVPTALARLRVEPSAAPVGEASSDILSVRRHETARGKSSDYYYLWNQTGARAHQSVTLVGDGRPYRLDTWTGTITPITDFERRGGSVTVDVDLAAHDATAIVLTERRDRTFRGGVGDKPEGTSKAGRAADPLALATWELSVDSWTPGPSGLPGDTAHTPVGPVTVRADEDGRLPAWRDITTDQGAEVDLRDVSGVGTYTTTFRLGREWRRVRTAALDLGSAIDTVRVAVNGTPLPPVNQADLAHVEVGKHLREGDNTITVTVASTLLNAVRVAPGTGASSRTPMDYGLFGPVRLTPTSGTDPYLLVEAMDRAVPLADGASNRARFLVTNRSSRPVRTEVAAQPSAGIDATAPARSVKVPAGGSRVVEVVVRRTDSTEDGSLQVTVTGDNGAHGSAAVALDRTSNLAANVSGAPFPALVVDATQDRYPAFLALDDDEATFTVSYGRTAGQGPTAERPWHIGVDLGLPTSVGSVTVGGRSLYGARDYTLEVSDDGVAWRTVATVVEAPKEGATTAVGAVETRFVRARITKAWDNGTPSNVQMSEFKVHAP
ncbi:glycosyl hydrolase [Mumia quercus]|uniref:glycosyl hydrolase n=1 Tax=Mumia quercus TaxID=2976125 RepID=UPI0021CE4B62|nr:glycosyl hydrolase [Mumia quercus]